MSRSSTVEKTIALSVSVRMVAALVLTATRCVDSAGAASQNVSGGARRRRRKQPHVDQLEELHVEAIGDPVQPVDELIGHPREGLDQRDARVGHVVVGPLGTALLHHPFRLVDEVLETAVVEIGDGKGHASPSLGMV